MVPGSFAHLMASDPWATARNQMDTIPHPIPYQGSKRRLIPDILARMPMVAGKLYEPFAGSAAVSLAVAARRGARHYVIADSLEPLVGIWELIVNSPCVLADEYERIWKSQGDPRQVYYNRIRAEFNATRDPAKLLFLLARCVKNAVRFNSSGEFNQSPDNRRLGTHPQTMRMHIMRAHHLLRHRTTLRACDYREVLKDARSEDFVYFDPPYQGTSGGRDQRYFQSLNFDEFAGELARLNERRISYLVSFDGSCGNRTYGKELPKSLGLERVSIHVGRSSQATLVGRKEHTVESLYISPALQERMPSFRPIGEAAQQLSIL